MRKVINKATAIRAVVLIFALIGILCIYPIRIFTSTLQTSGGGTIVGESERINYDHNNLMQEFVAQYDRLSSIDVYVTNVENGRYISSLLYDENGGIILMSYVDTNEFTIPGYVTIPMEVNVEVGKNYALKLRDCRSKYFVGYEDVPETPGYVGNLTVDYVNIEGRHLAANYNYRIPLSRKYSMGIIAVIAILAILVCFFTGQYYKKYPEKNSVLTVGKTLMYTLNPVAAIVIGMLMIMVFPLKLFDSRPVDIVFYELGLIITAVIVFYGINHKVVVHKEGVSFWQSLKNEDRVQYVLIMFSIAMAIWYACVYMNDLYDIYHTISERHMAFWLLIAMILTFTVKEVLTPYNLIWLLGSGIYGIYYYNANKLAETEKEYDLHNIILKYGIYIVILSGFLVLNFIRILVMKIRERRYGADDSTKTIVRPSLLGGVILVYFASLVVFRNTRVWGIYLALTFLCFFLRLAAWDKKKDYYKILSGGLMINFGISLIYCYLHRYFAGYVSGRFGFLFHTVTVTAEYFTFMGAVAAVMLVIKIVSLPRGTSLKGIVGIAWKEMTLFGFIMSYAIFTVSRTAYVAIFMSLLLVICVVISYNKKQFLRIVGVSALSFVLCFPAAFTLQRILPTIAADPVIYPIDDTDEFIRGGADWDNTNFMCVERFVNLFESKILGMDVGTYEYPIDKYNYELDGYGEPLYDLYGRPYEDSPDNPNSQYYEDNEENGENEGEETGIDTGRIEAEPGSDLLASTVFTHAEYIMLMDEIAGYVDTSNIIDVISNGRITIFKSYLQQLNMWGHEEMGAMLPNGETAVHAHNTYLQVAYDHGIVVGILFIITLITALASSIKHYIINRQKDVLCLVSCAVIIGFMVAGLTEWVFTYANPMTVALMLSVAPLTYKVKER